ncbi:MAG: electron transport complex subunit E [Clostridia bacterium]|nr:electron transport complex subunit E [Clostridia bacterium]
MADKKSGGYSFRAFLGQLKSGVIDQNPTLVQVLGMCPTLATTTSLTNALGMGLATTVVLAFSNLFISLLRKFIPKQVRIAAYIVIISGFVTAVEMLMKAYFTDLYQSLGVFISLIVVNCIILARAEAFASKNKPLPSFVDGIAMGLGFTGALSILGIVREILGAGTIAGVQILGSSFQPAQMFIMPAGAFITLGCLIALVQKLKSVSEEKRKEKENASVTEATDKVSEGGNE